MIHPTRRAAVALAVAAPVAFGAAFAAPNWWLAGVFWLILVLAAVVVDALALLARRRLEVELRCPTVLHVGEREAVTLLLRGRRPAATDVVLDLEGPAQPLAPATVAADDEPAASLRFALRTTRRGTVRLPRVWLRAPGPLGMASRTLRVELDRAVAVVPNIAAVRRQALAFSAADAPLGAKPQHQKGSGTEFEALREYAAGLDSRAMDWKHSARHRKLVCKEFQTERNHHVVLALDTGRLMNELVEGVPKLDRACTALLLLAYVSLKAGDRVGLAAFDARTRAFVSPMAGMASMALVQKTFAAVDYSSDETNFTLALTELAGRLTRRALVVIATDFVDTVTAELMVRNVGHLAKQHLVIFAAPRDTTLSRRFAADLDGMEDVSRAVVAHGMLRERQAVFARLARLGVLCVEAQVERLGPELINRYLAIKARDLI